MMKSRSEALCVVARHRAEPPVDLPALARDLGLEIACQSLPRDYAGTIEPKAGHEGFKLVVNAAHGEARRHFTLAHLIGHAVLHADLIGEGLVEGGAYKSVGWGYCHNRRIGTHEEIETHWLASTLIAAPALREMARAFRAGTYDPSAAPAGWN